MSRLFSHGYKRNISNSPIDDILKELSLFKQTAYCCEYIKKQCPGKSNDEIQRQAEVSSSSFRQAFEFLDSAKSTYISTSPLLYSYSLNNFAKGFAYLSTFDSNITNYFKKHGFKIEDANIAENLLDSLVTLEKSGPPTAILKLLNNHIVEKQVIPFRKLLEHIPEIADVYLKTTHLCSHTAKANPQNGYYELKSENLEEDSKTIQEVIEHLKCVTSYYGRSKILSISLHEPSLTFIRENNNFDNVFYKDNLILPLKLEEGIFSINIMFFTYLIIMGYGMLVRYNPDKWEKFIDPKISNESVLINESLIQCVQIFITHIHKLLFGSTYEVLKYSDENVKQVINDSTEEIMESIKRKIIRNARASGNKPFLPW